MDSNAALSDYQNLFSQTSTFLSVDVAGSTQLKNGEQEQDVIYTFLGYHKLIRQMAYTYHGEVMNISGDGIMCRFERPDDAAAAALQIILEIPGFNQRQNRLAHPFQLRIGVHTGEVYENKALSPGQIISHTLDVTAKLQQTCPSNGVRFSQDTISLLKQTQLPLTRIGWDVALNVNIYQYRGGKVKISHKKDIPSPFKVLVVDQDLDDLLIIRKILFSRSYQAIPAYNVNQAALCTTALNPHVIMVNADLPWETGWELLKNLRMDDAFSSLPIILMSRHMTGQMIEKGITMGANGLLVKPAQESQIIKRIDRVIQEFYQ